MYNWIRKFWTYKNLFAITCRLSHLSVRRYELFGVRIEKRFTSSLFNFFDFAQTWWDLYASCEYDKHSTQSVKNNNRRFNTTWIWVARSVYLWTLKLIHTSNILSILFGRFSPFGFFFFFSSSTVSNWIFLVIAITTMMISVSWKCIRAADYVIPSELLLLLLFSLFIWHTIERIWILCTHSIVSSISMYKPIRLSIFLWASDHRLRRHLGMFFSFIFVGGAMMKDTK